VLRWARWRGDRRRERWLAGRVGLVVAVLWDFSPFSARYTANSRR